MANNDYRLSVRRGPEEGQTFPLTSASVTVGRDPMADIVLSDPEVSRQHARFTRTEEGYELQDLGSTNGTFVDGKRLAGEAMSLQPGAVITMGSNVTMVLEGTADPMATVVSPGSDLDFDEPEASEEDDALRTMIESPEEEVEDAPGFESPAADFDDDAMVSDSESTAMEFPSTADTGPLRTPEEEPEDDFSFDFEEADYGEPIGPGSGVDPDDRTVLDMEASDFSSFSAEREDDSLPSFDEPSYGSESELPSFEEEPEPAGKPPAESPERIPPPLPSPPPKSESEPNRNRNIIIGVIALLLLCCCCSILVTYFYLGDVILQYMQF
ncbi:MAG: FHA domain-containing protein [Chloroflexota bacterium]